MMQPVCFMSLRDVLQRCSVQRTSTLSHLGAAALLGSSTSKLLTDLGNTPTECVYSHYLSSHYAFHKLLNFVSLPPHQVWQIALNKLKIFTLCFCMHLIQWQPVQTSVTQAFILKQWTYCTYLRHICSAQCRWDIEMQLGVARWDVMQWNASDELARCGVLYCSVVRLRTCMSDVLTTCDVEDCHSDIAATTAAAACIRSIKEMWRWCTCKRASAVWLDDRDRTDHEILPCPAVSSGQWNLCWVQRRCQR